MCGACLQSGPMRRGRHGGWQSLVKVLLMSWVGAGLLLAVAGLMAPSGDLGSTLDVIFAGWPTSPLAGGIDPLGFLGVLATVAVAVTVALNSLVATTESLHERLVDRKDAVRVDVLARLESVETLLRLEFLVCVSLAGFVVGMGAWELAASAGPGVPFVLLTLLFYVWLVTEAARGLQTKDGVRRAIDGAIRHMEVRAVRASVADAQSLLPSTCWWTVLLLFPVVALLLVGLPKSLGDYLLVPVMSGAVGSLCAGAVRAFRSRPPSARRTDRALEAGLACFMGFVWFVCTVETIAEVGSGTGPLAPYRSSVWLALLIVGVSLFWGRARGFYGEGALRGIVRADVGPASGTSLGRLENLFARPHPVRSAACWIGLLVVAVVIPCLALGVPLPPSSSTKDAWEPVVVLIVLEMGVAVAAGAGTLFATDRAATATVMRLSLVAVLAAGATCVIGAWDRHPAGAAAGGLLIVVAGALFAAGAAGMGPMVEIARPYVWARKRRLAAAALTRSDSVSISASEPARRSCGSDGCLNESSSTTRGRASIIV